MSNEGKANSNKRITHIILIILGVGFLIFFKLFQTSFIEGPKLRAKADSYTIKKVEIVADRGNIFSADGKLLATSMPVYDLKMDPSTPSDENFNNGIKGLGQGLAHIFPVKTATQWQNYITGKRQQGKRYIHIKKAVTYSEYQAVKKLPIFKLDKYKGGLIVERHNYRKMPFNLIAQRTIGYDNTTNQAGIEGAYSSYLAGENGEQWKQKIAKGQWKPIESSYTIPPKNGLDITTCLDTRIQDVAHSELIKTLIHFEADHGSVLVMEVATGKIRAVANLGRTEQGDYKELRNYAVWESTEPGSTFKLASLMVSMEDGYVDTSTIVDTKDGIYTIYGKKIKDSNVKYGRGGYGKITVAEAFRKSSNTGIVKAVYPFYKDKPEDFVDQLYKMGLHKTLDLEIKGETPPTILSPEDPGWSGTTLPWMAFGYSVSLTPLQLLTFYNAVANEGVMVKPQFVQSVNDHGRVVVNNETVVLNSSICSKETLHQLQALLEGVVKKGGTASNLQLKDIKLAGKTGTCQLDYWKGGHKYQASFAGYFPADNPKYSCIVVINAPNNAKGYYGNIVAGPIFKAIAEEIYLMTPHIEEVEVQAVKNTNTHKLAKAEEALHKNYMPSLNGLSAPEAIQVLENSGLQVSVVGNGRVYKQQPKVGVSLNNFNSVKLLLR